MPVTLLRFAALLFVAISMSAGFAHLFALPNKIDVPASDYLIVQQIYRGWALLGIANFGALVSTIVLMLLERHNRTVFYLSLTAALCIALSLAVFFAFTFPANQATLNWTVLPENWQTLRQRWEYSHAVGALLYLLAFIALLAAMPRRGGADCR